MCASSSSTLLHSFIRHNVLVGFRFIYYTAGVGHYYTLHCFFAASTHRPNYLVGAYCLFYCLLGCSWFDASFFFSPAPSLHYYIGCVWVCVFPPSTWFCFLLFFFCSGMLCYVFSTWIRFPFSFPFLVNIDVWVFFFFCCVWVCCCIATKL